VPRTILLGKDQQLDVVTKEDWDDLKETLGAISESMKELKASVPKGLETRSAASAHPPSRPEGSQSYYCPTCAVETQDPFTHMKNDPEKHGLVKRVEVVKEVPKKRSMQEILSEHDIFECPECKAVIDEWLGKKGRKIVEAEEEKGWSLEL